MILKRIFTGECINISKLNSICVNIFFPSIANLKFIPSDRKGCPKGTCIAEMSGLSYFAIQS